MKIGALSRRLGVGIGGLRFYERIGLLRASRSDGGTRLYSEGDAARVEAILALTRLDIPLATLKELAAIRPASATGDVASRKVAAMLADLRRHVDDRRQACEALAADLARAEAVAKRCFGCALPPRRKVCAGCEVSAGLDDAQVLALVWDQEESSSPAGAGDPSSR